VRGHRGLQPGLRESSQECSVASEGCPAPVSIGVGRRAGRAGSLHWTSLIEHSLSKSGREIPPCGGDVHPDPGRTGASIVGGESLGVRVLLLVFQMSLFRGRILEYEPDTTRLRSIAGSEAQELWTRRSIRVERGNVRSGSWRDDRPGARDSAAAPHGPEVSAARPRLRDRAWIVGLLASWDAAPEGASRARGQWAVKDGSSGSSSPDASIEPGAHGECDSSTNPIVLVSRVITGLSTVTTLRQRGRQNGPAPLPFLMTFPVSFERDRNSSTFAKASIASEFGVRAVGRESGRSLRK
jgi:hypothetical protein